VVIPLVLTGDQCEGAGQTREPWMPVDGVGPTCPFAWIGSRVAHPARDLARSTAYYRDLLHLQPSGGFAGHDAYNGVFFALPGGGELELTAGPVAQAAGTDEDLLVLYVCTIDEVRAIGASLVSAGVRSVDSPNPYWDRCGQTFLDPDGYRIVIAAGAVSVGEPRELAAGHDGPPNLDIDWQIGTRDEHGLGIKHVLLDNKSLGKISKEQVAGDYPVWHTCCATRTGRSLPGNAARPESGSAPRKIWTRR